MSEKTKPCEIRTTVWDAVKVGVLEASNISLEEFASGSDITQEQAVAYAHALDSALYGAVGMMLELHWTPAQIGMIFVRTLQSHGATEVEARIVKVAPPIDPTKATPPTGAGMN